MKIFISFLMAAVIVGFIFFAIFYWLVHKKFNEALLIGMCGAFGGFVSDYIRERKKNRIIKQ